MRIDIISLGKFKQTLPYLEIFNFYKKRIRTKVNLIELKTFNYNEKKKTFEKEEIIKYLNDKDFVIALDKDGKNFSSREFAKTMSQKMLDGTNRICFLIGSEIGLDRYFIESYESISFGRQTWPHILVRVMLIEQIYRAFEIIKCSSYHK